MIPRLCFVSDGARGTAGRPLVPLLRRAAGAGLRMAVLRELALGERELRALLEEAVDLRAVGLHLLVSRRVDLVLEYGLDGVHLAADATPVAAARAKLGAAAWIGYSAHSGPEARAAAGAGASYVTLSPIYPTASKPGAPGRGPAWLEEAARGLEVPALALGGLTPARVREVRTAGAHGVAAVSSIGAAPDVAAAVREFLAALAADEEEVR